MRTTLPLLLLALAGCGSDVPTWALDPVFLDPGPAGVTGTQAWQIYSPRWDRRFAERHYLCAVLVTFDASPRAPDCEGCARAFDVQPELADSDCAEGMAADPLWTSLIRVGMAEPAGDGPHPGASSVAWADYGAGWEPYGWAQPDALTRDAVPNSLAWDGSEPFALLPTAAWNLSAGTTTALSRSGAPGGPGIQRGGRESPVWTGSP